MRIIHVITRLILGGAQENTLLTVEGLMRLGHSVSLVTGPPEGPEGQLVDRARAAGVDLVMMDDLVRPVRPLTDLRAYRKLVRYFRAQRPDVVHTHSAKAGVLGRYAAHKARVACIIHTIHGLPFHPTQSRPAFKTYVALERRTARYCARIISVADAMTEQALAQGIGRPEQFVTIYSGMDVDTFLRADADRDATRAALGIAPDDIVVGKIARLFELKGHEYLLPAMKTVIEAEPRARLLLVGSGILRDALERMAGDLGIRERVIFTGLVPPERIPAVIGAMDIVAHCSLREGLARVLPQALIAGRPAVSFDVDGAREVVLDGITGRLIPAPSGQGSRLRRGRGPDEMRYAECGMRNEEESNPQITQISADEEEKSKNADAESVELAESADGRVRHSAFRIPHSAFQPLAAAILDLVRHPDRARQMGAEGRRRFADQFRTETMVHRIDEVYREACGHDAR